MTAYLARRVLHALLVLLIVTLVAFLLIHLVPGDPIRIMLGAQAPPAAVERVRHQLGLDRSLLPEQFVIVRRPRRRSGDLRRRRSSCSGPLSVVSASGSARASSCSATARSSSLLARGPARDLSRRSAATGSPDHGIRLVAHGRVRDAAVLARADARRRCSASTSGWFPVSGYGTGFLGHLDDLTLPAITIGLFLAPMLIRTLRSSLIETLSDRLHRGRARARASGGARGRQARAAQRADRDDHDPRGQHRLPDRRQRRGRERLRHPRPRLAARRRRS